MRVLLAGEFELRLEIEVADRGLSGHLRDMAPDLLLEEALLLLGDYAVVFVFLEVDFEDLEGGNRGRDGGRFSQLVELFEVQDIGPDLFSVDLQEREVPELDELSESGLQDDEAPLEGKLELDEGAEAGEARVDQVHFPLADQTLVLYLEAELLEAGDTSKTLSKVLEVVVPGFLDESQGPEPADFLELPYEPVGDILFRAEVEIQTHFLEVREGGERELFGLLAPSFVPDLAFQEGKL